MLALARGLLDTITISREFVSREVSCEVPFDVAKGVRATAGTFPRITRQSNTRAGANTPVAGRHFPPDRIGTIRLCGMSPTRLGGLYVRGVCHARVCRASAARYCSAHVTLARASTQRNRSFVDVHEIASVLPFAQIINRGFSAATPTSPLRKPKARSLSAQTATTCKVQPPWLGSSRPVCRRDS